MHQKHLFPTQQNLSVMYAFNQKLSVHYMPGNEMGTFTNISLDINNNSLRHILFPDQGNESKGEEI